MDSFPIPYFPVRYSFHGISSIVSRGGFNIAKALPTLGNDVSFLSAFLHAYVESGDPYTSIQKAAVFASYKICEKGAAEGFLDRGALNHLYDQMKNQL